MDRQGNGDPGNDESATASWEVGGGSEAGAESATASWEGGGGSEAGAEVTGVTRGSEPEAEGVRGGVLAGVTAGPVGGGSKAQAERVVAEASSKAGGGSVAGAEVEGSSASFVAEGMGVPLVLTAAEMAAQGFDIGVDIVLATMEEEEDVDPDAEAEFDAMMLATDNLRFAQNSRQVVMLCHCSVSYSAHVEIGSGTGTGTGMEIYDEACRLRVKFIQNPLKVPPADTFQPVNENEVNVDPVAEAEFDAMILAANNFRFAQQMRQWEWEWNLLVEIYDEACRLRVKFIQIPLKVPSADTFQPENENEDERVPTNQPNPENDTLYGSSISQQIQNDTLHGSSIPQGGDSNTLHGSSIPQGGDNDPGSATWFKLKVPSAFQGLTVLWRC
ncbi:hypothetical protein TRIUR3_25726 [Triticum urartu]|uniref:Uncharacterized protein n=1 Tax=Triticum urartu TaxID=4572 RepID=M7YL45_TRIUA|nr:hypothetical protein TRIUR3_25726 [Triticum urartu]